MSKKIILIVGIVILVLIGVVVFLYQSTENNKYPPNMTAKQKTQLKKLEKAHEELIKRSKSGKFFIEGKVIDDKGNPLHNVKVNITKSISRGFMGCKTSTRKKNINEEFSLNESGCNVLHLEFLKRGYFSANRSYNIKMKPRGNISIKGSQLTAKKQIIVLREIGELANLKSRDEKFYMDPVSKKQDIMDLINFKKITVKASNDIKIPKYFSLSLKRDKDGKPEMVIDKFKKMIPAGIYLNYISNDKTDGIRLVNDLSVKDMRDMPTAPEAGYKLKQIPLKISRAGDFFYYKNGDTYGKVWVQQTFFIGKRVKSVILVKENNEKDPQKKRNLRSYAY